MPLPGVPAGCVHVREAQVKIPAFAAAALRLPDPFVLIQEAGEVRLRLRRQRAHDAATDGDDEPAAQALRIGDAGSEEPRVGEESVSPCRTRWTPSHKTKKKKPNHEPQT